MVYCTVCRRGALIVRRLCVLLGAEKVYREFSTILEKEGNLDFASTMVQVCLIDTIF
jgi:vacuole morphology and inheritance protein 14